MAYGKTYQWYVEQAIHRACNKKDEQGLSGMLTKYIIEVLNNPIERKQFLKTIIDKGMPTAAPVKIDGNSAVTEISVVHVINNGKTDDRITPTSTPRFDTERPGEV